mgnify:CR=1 FL=1
MDLMKISDFCRKYKLPAYRFTRYKYAFALAPKEGYKAQWVKINDHNLALVADIIGHTGTRRKKPRLTLEAFCKKHGVTDQHFKKVCHRMQLEEHDGQMLVVDSKQNYALLKHGRLIRKKS